MLQRVLLCNSWKAEIQYCGIANIVDSFMRNCLHFCHFGGVCHFAFILNNLFYFQLWAGLRFTVPRLKDTHKFVQFDLQIRRYET